MTFVNNNFIANCFVKSIFRKNVVLAPYTHFKIGGPADYFFEAKNAQEIIKALDKWRRLYSDGRIRPEQIPSELYGAGISRGQGPSERYLDAVFILGGGTNILVSDEGFRGIVIKIQNSKFKIQDSSIIADAGVSIGQLVNYSITHNLSGLEWAGGLPGTLGGAIRGNAGCFGREMKDIIEEVVSLSTESPYRIIRRNKQECGFEYRNSIFKKSEKEVILEAKIHLKKGKKEEIKKIAQKNINYRLNNHPMEHPSAGSIFKNVPFKKAPKQFQSYFKQWLKKDPLPLIPAGIIIKEAGLNGHIIGGAQVSEKHNNFIINTGGAKSSDVKSLIDLIKKTVQEKFNINLEEEIVYVGQF